MRRLFFVGLVGVLAACSGDDPVVPDALLPSIATDAGVDASRDAPPDAAPVPRTLFESATVAAGPFAPLPARSCDGWQPMVGVRLVTTQPYTITELGALVRRACEDCAARTMVMAIVPLDPTTNLPKTADLSDAIGSGTAEVAYTPSEMQPAAPPATTFPVHIELPAGTWGLVVGSGRLGTAPVEADLSDDVDPVGTQHYFVYSGDSERWIVTQAADGHNRFFVTGY